MSLHYAILWLCRAQEPRLMNVFELDANARVPLRAGRPDQMTLEDVYVVLQQDVQALY